MRSQYTAELQKNQLFTEYIIYFNIGGVWNLIVRWIENDMRDSVTDIKKSLSSYLSNISEIDI